MRSRHRAVGSRDPRRRRHYAPGPCGPLATTWSIVMTAVELRGAEVGRTLRESARWPPTILPRSTGDEDAGA